jgi:uncharacterized membrane protein YbaN (DUF454 family)
MPAVQPHDSPLVRALFLGAGGIALALGLLGVFLPILPTTPFVLLAAACFARGSTTLHDRLLAHRVAGPIIREWHEHRAMPPGVKPWAYLLMAVSFGASILLMSSPWHRAMLAALAAALAFFLWRVPVRPPAPPQGGQ